MREIRKSGSEGGARQTNVSFLPLSMSAIGAIARTLTFLVSRLLCLAADDDYRLKLS